MSADNFLAIWQDPDGVFRAFMQSASAVEITRDADERPVFEATTLPEAVRMAQEESTEYGYFFVNIHPI